MRSPVIRVLAWAAVPATAVAAVAGACGSDNGAANGSGSGSADEAVGEQAPLPADCRPAPPLRSGQVVLGCTELDDGRELQVRTLRHGPRRSGCLEIYGVGGGMSRACVHAPEPPERRRPVPTRPILVSSIAQEAASRSFEIYGTAAASVDRVVVHHRAQAGRRMTRPATVIAVDDEPALSRANLGEPFFVFFAELPAETRTAIAVARDDDGARVGTADFAPHLRTVDREVLIYALE